MPGRRINRTQVAKYMEHRKELEQEAAAAKVGISVRSARRIERTGGLPSKQQPRQWRTRADPLAPWWESEVVPLLTTTPTLNAVTILEELQRRYASEVSPALLRTLQRRLRQWRAEQGGEREVYFAQEHPPGRLGLSDFTDGSELDVAVQGRPFAHRLYQLALAYSGWRHVEVVLGGESFEALAAGLQNALWQLGGVPQEHRTDSLSAAFRNLNAEAAKDFTQRYEALCAHYAMRASRNNPGASHENGAIESRQGTLKDRLDQALLLRGSRSFASLEHYRQFVGEVALRLNARIAKAFAVERATLRSLPLRRTADYEELQARVSKFGTFNVRGVLYSAPSRLIGHRLTVRLYLERVEAFVGGVNVLTLPRARPAQRRVIDYRHVLPARAVARGLICVALQCNVSHIVIRSFRHKGLERFFRKGDHRGVPAQSANRIRRMLDALDAAAAPEELNLPGYRFHELKGDRSGTYSLTVTGNVRVTFAFEGEDAVQVNLEDYH